MKAICKTCTQSFDVAEQIGGKIGMAAAGALLGGNATKHPAGFLIGMLVGAFIGHQLDQDIRAACPDCGTALTLLEIV
jgi:hypothetical protein